MALHRYLTPDGQVTPAAVEEWGLEENQEMQHCVALWMQEQLLSYVITLPQLLYLRRRPDSFLLVVEEEPSLFLLRYPCLNHPFCQVVISDETAALSRVLAGITL